MIGTPPQTPIYPHSMKTITLLLAATGALFLSSCASTQCASCCSSDTAAKPCCKDAAAKGVKCDKCATMKKAS